MYARILALLDGSDADEAVLAMGDALAQAQKARLAVLFIDRPVTDALPMVGEGISAATIEHVLAGLEEAAAERKTSALGRIERWSKDKSWPRVEPNSPLQRDVFSVSFAVRKGRLDRVIGETGRIADLTVIAKPEEDSEAASWDAFDAALFLTGRPVMLVPKANTSQGAPRHFAMAWSGARESALAAALTLPLLQAAETVSVLTARDGAAKTEPSLLAHYLRGHGVEAETWAFTPGDGGLGMALLAEAKSAKADALVMGGYGHSRLREWVLGGATRDVLIHADIPVILAH